MLICYSLDVGSKLGDCYMSLNFNLNEELMIEIFGVIVSFMLVFLKSLGNSLSYKFEGRNYGVNKLGI